MADHRLSEMQKKVLAGIRAFRAAYDTDPVAAREVADSAGVSPKSTRDILRELELQGWVVVIRPTRTSLPRYRAAKRPPRAGT